MSKNMRLTLSGRDNWLHAHISDHGTPSLTVNTTSGTAQLIGTDHINSLRMMLNAIERLHKDHKPGAGGAYPWTSKPNAQTAFNLDAACQQAMNRITERINNRCAALQRQTDYEFALSRDWIRRTFGSAA